MEIINLGKQNSVLNYFISELRCIEKQVDPMRFRRNLERIGEIFAYEVSKSLDYQSQTVETPLDKIAVPMHSDSVVVASILRAGLPLHTGLLNYFDRAENAFISAYRKYKEDGSFDIHSEYFSAPVVEDKVVILSDPMLASGLSMEVGYEILLGNGNPKHTHIVAIIASRQGVEYIEKNLREKNVTLWVGAIDESLTDKSYISPGLGDAGDLAFGEKL